MTGRWFEGPEVDEITIEWKSCKKLVQHVLSCKKLAWCDLEQNAYLHELGVDKQNEEAGA